MNRVQVMMIPVITGLYIKKVPKMSLRTIRNRVLFYAFGSSGMIK